MVKTLGVGAEETAISAAAVRRTECCPDGAGKLRRRVPCSRTAQCCMQPQDGEEFPRNSPHSAFWSLLAVELCRAVSIAA